MAPSPDIEEAAMSHLKPNPKRGDDGSLKVASFDISRYVHIDSSIVMRGAYTWDINASLCKRYEVACCTSWVLGERWRRNLGTCRSGRFNGRRWRRGLSAVIIVEILVEVSFVF